MRFYFSAQIIPAMAIGSSFSLVPMVLSVCMCVYLALLPLPCFLAPQNADLVFTFPAPILESAISPKNHGSFYWRILLETKIWIVDMLLIAIRVC